jgi:two-component system, chemotaxis family, protein-glutamate methylesterase/glutaminase
MSDFRLVAIGASWGGLDAIGRLLSALPRDLGAAIAVAQHRGRDLVRNGLKALLATRCALPLEEADDKTAIRLGHVYLAPADYHLLVERGTFALSVDEPVHFTRPSIDVLLQSAADAYGPQAIGIVLTGSNQGGAAGLARVKERGGFTIVQDPDTAERREMPDAAIAASVIDRVLPLEQIPPLLVELCGTSVVA